MIFPPASGNRLNGEARIRCPAGHAGSGPPNLRSAARQQTAIAELRLRFRAQTFDALSSSRRSCAICRTRIDAGQPPRNLVWTPAHLERSRAQGVESVQLESFGVQPMLVENLQGQ